MPLFLSGRGEHTHISFWLNPLIFIIQLYISWLKKETWSRCIFCRVLRNNYFKAKPLRFLKPSQEGIKSHRRMIVSVYPGKPMWLLLRASWRTYFTGKHDVQRDVFRLIEHIKLVERTIKAVNCSHFHWECLKDTLHISERLGVTWLLIAGFL